MIAALIAIVYAYLVWLLFLARAKAACKGARVEYS